MHLAAGQSHAAVTHDGVVATGVIDVLAQPCVHDRPVEGPAVAERDVVGEGSGEDPGHLRDVGHLSRTQEDLRVLDLDPVPRDRPGVVEQSGQAAQQARLARPDLTEQEHELAGADREVDAFDAARAVVVDGPDPLQLEHAQGDLTGYVGAGSSAFDEVDPFGHRDEVDASGESARGLLPGPRARRLRDDGAGHPAEPVEPVDGTGDEDGRGQAPATGRERRPGSDDADLHHDDRDPVEDRLDPVLEDGRLDPPGIHGSKVLPRGGGGRGELDGACRLEHGHQGAPEPGPGGGRLGG